MTARGTSTPTGRPVYTQTAEPTAEVVYGRRLLSDAAALIRDGAIGGPDEDLSPHDATRVRSEIASWLDMFARTLKAVSR
jgi:hypothetical protein